MRRKYIPTSEELSIIEELYYKQKLSIDKTSEQVGLKPDVIKRILREYFSGARTGKDMYKARAESMKGVKWSEEALENMRRGWKKRSTKEYIQKISKAKLGEKNASAKLTADDVRKIRQEYKEGFQKGMALTALKENIGNKYNVKRQTINDIIAGRTWKHVKP